MSSRKNTVVVGCKKYINFVKGWDVIKCDDCLIFTPECCEEFRQSEGYTRIREEA